MSNKIVLQLEPSSQNSRNSEGAFVTLRDGRIAFAWSKYVTENSDDNARAMIACVFSDDGGNTWGGETVLAEPTLGEANVMSVSLLRLQDGRILCSYLRKIKHADGTYDCRPVVRFSSDDLTSLSEATLVTPVPGYYVLNNDRVIQLKNGRLLMPLALHRFRLPPLAGHDGSIAPVLARSAQIIILHSDDCGHSWLESIN
ncbi:MAG: sialidase family protein, partial [Abditibacteriaceae bacterium]